jgi:3-hydroxybutyryl-CoA dehydrogenase
LTKGNIVLSFDKITGLDISAKNLESLDFIDPPIDNQPKSLFEFVKRGDLGVKIGKVFFGYRGRRPEEVLKERDMNLLRIYKNTEFCLEEKTK